MSRTTVMLAVGTMAAILGMAAGATTVVHMTTVTELSKTLPGAGGGDLWVVADDLPRINGFTLKAEGMCKDEICIPVRQDRDSNLYESIRGTKWLNLSQFARNLQQSYVHDAETDVWSFGETPLTRDRFLQSGEAPDFALKDRTGKTVRLSDFRGKKVLLVTWASWCGCRLDVAAWQPIYESLKARDFELISVAEDTAGEAAAGPIFDAAKVTYTALIDPTHLISSLYNFVNVPSAAWIDEQGRIVRINEGTYAQRHKLGAMTIGTDDYTPAVRDWVEKGSASQYVWSKQQVAGKIRGKSAEEAKAEAIFQLGTYFHQQKNGPKAEQYWNMAQSLFPDSWNMHRQEWAIDEPQNANSNWAQKFRGLRKPYYSDLELQQAKQTQ
jgi:peroxiredoxin